MCHLQDKLALGERLGWLAQLRSREDGGPEHRALQEAGRPRSGERKQEGAFPRGHFESDPGNHTWIAPPPAVILAVYHLVTAGGKDFSSAL